MSKMSKLTREQVLEEALRRYKNKAKQGLRQVPDNGCRHRFEDSKGKTFVVHAFPGTCRVNWSRSKTGKIKYYETPAPADFYLLAGQEGEKVRVWFIPMKVLAELVYNGWVAYEAEQGRAYNEVTFFPKAPSRKLRGSSALFIGEHLAKYEIAGETKVRVVQPVAEVPAEVPVIETEPQTVQETLVAPVVRTQLPVPIAAAPIAIKRMYYPCLPGAFQSVHAGA
jgi:hypothetical protein